MNDLRFALRQLRQSPGFTCVAVLTLALGIGATTAIFSVVKAVLLSALPYPHYERLVVGWQTTTESANFPFSWPNYLDYAAKTQSYEELALSQRSGANLTGAGGPERVTTASVTANYFDVAGVKPALGRSFTAEEDRPGAAPVLVLSDAAWQRLFQRDPGALGRTLTLNGTVFTVIGVMPAEMDLPQAVDLWRPLGLLTDSPGFQERGNFPSLFALGRLKPGVTLEDAQREATAIWAQIKAEFPQSITTGIALQPLVENRVGQYRRGLLLLFGAVGLVLLIACANLSNLLLARGAQRTTEIAVRTALGASRAQIVRQLLIESLLLAGLGGGLGVALALAARQMIVALSPAGVARFQAASIDLPVMLFGLGLALAAGVAFGLWPAWSASQVDLRTAMQAGGRGGSAGPGRKRMREALIVAEVALTLVLLVGAGLLLKSFARIQAVNLGFRPENLLLGQISFPAPAYPNPKMRAEFVERLLPRLAELPGVAAAALNTAPPMSPGWQTLFFVEGRQYPAGQGAPLTDVATISDNYFAVAGISLLRGRPFAPSDLADGPKVVIIDERMAKTYWPGEDPVGKRMGFAGGIGQVEIIGVAPTLRLYGYASEPPVPQVYFLQRQVPAMNTVTVLLRTHGDPLALRAALADVVRRVDPAQPVFNVRTMEQDIARTQVTARLYTHLLGCFSGLALLLAAVGLYGVISYSTAQRTREIGIRLALGAVSAEVFRLILRDGFRLIAVGTALGLAAALALAQLTRSLLFGVSTADASVYAGVVVLLGAIAALACWLPARRAARVDPLVALRAE
jgi:putative ABC transport system permease protein